ncbi:MAG: tetratricopeptide repeat protein [Methanospirillum sp.]|uniref:tetratricopeptide repeat protein n=1 Tax=Methanospirillum sp. TaxID=45200 RepID=UPI002371C5D1|nr:tetratricopeptide repeat protein [Methanospirillum sp.]MDD1729690.1 tetratricopeptide repeat protein [Methanospirillum sp.]
MSSRELIQTVIPLVFLLLTISVFISGCIGTQWTASDWLEKGNQYANDGLYTSAIDAYNQSLQLDARNAKVLTYRGVALEHLGSYPAAMQDFEQALSINPNESGAWQGKAATYIDTSEYRLAVKAADRAIELANTPADKAENAYLLRGFALNRLEDYDGALQAFDQAIEIDPRRLDLWQNKAYSLTKLGRFVEVLKCYEVMVGIEPKNAELWSKKGEIHLALGQINEANEAFSIAKNLIKN